MYVCCLYVGFRWSELRAFEARLGQEWGRGGKCGHPPINFLQSFFHNAGSPFKGT